jgi:thiosulfate dehydrogenase
VNSHDRPQDPRFKGSVAQTRDAYHDEDCLYGRTPDELAASLEKQAAATAARPASGK